MSHASRTADARPRDRAERLRPWIGALLTALLHGLLVLLVLLSPPITVTPPQGTAAGSTMEVTYIDRALEPPPPTPVRKPPTRKPPSRPRPTTPPAPTRLQTTLVVQAVEPVPPDPSEPAATPDVTDDATQTPAPAPAPAASPPSSTQRRSRSWGQPPGMLPDNLAAANAGSARSRSVEQGRSNAASSGPPNLEVDGYQVLYDLISENRLRAWRDQGMTELFLPLPGTRRLMVCPLEVALRRGSGDCRMVEPDAPELKAIGDAREVINMQRVYKLGENVWSGPGPYR